MFRHLWFLQNTALHKPHINLGTSHDTSEFACDSVLHWWRKHGRADHPEATGYRYYAMRNPANSWLFTQDLQRLSNETVLKIRVAHYPPCCSQHNPIEHRVFPHVSRACEGVIFTSVELVKNLMQRTSTRTGLSVTVDILSRIYETGRKAVEELKSIIRLVRDEILPELNYTITPAN